jgi:serine/threonine protein phosphatase PrpC
MTTITYGASSHVGMKRDHNEDSYLMMPEMGVFAVCDGMGGHASGEVASKLACDEIKQFFEMTSSDRDATWPFKLDKTNTYDENRIQVAVKLANKMVMERSKTDPKCRGMGTTFVGIYFTEEGKLLVAHAGDSRAYLYRGGELKRITIDHSLVEEYIRMGRLTEEEAKNFPQKNIILRALGQQEKLDVEVNSHKPEDGDIFLVCSDGLSGMIDDARMQDILKAKGSDLDSCSQAMIDAANAAGGLDNVTCVLARWTK